MIEPLKLKLWANMIWQKLKITKDLGWISCIAVFPLPPLKRRSVMSRPQHVKKLWLWNAPTKTELHFLEYKTEVEEYIFETAVRSETSITVRAKTTLKIRLPSEHRSYFRDHIFHGLLSNHTVILFLIPLCSQILRDLHGHFQSGLLVEKTKRSKYLYETCFHMVKRRSRLCL